MIQDPKFKKVALVAASLLVIFLAFVALNSAWDLFAKWGWVSSPDTQKTITLSAEGKTTVTPDTARFSVGVVTRGDDPQRIQDENTKAINKIIDFLKSEGVKDGDIKTTQYDLYPQYDYFEGRQIPNGYILNQTIQVTVREIDKAGALLSGSIERGSNQVSSVQFYVDDPDKFKGEAREEAFAKARDKAKELADQAGVRLGKVVSFSESSYGGIQPPIYYARSEAVGLGGGGVPDVEPGSQELTVSVTVTYEIR